MILAFIISTQLLSTPAQSQNTEFWVSKLQSSSLDLRINALTRLAEIKDPISIEPIQTLLNDSEAEIRAAAARALGRFPYEDSLKALEAALSSEKDSYVKSELNRSIRGLRQTFKKQEEKAKGGKASTTPTEAESEDFETTGE